MGNMALEFQIYRVFQKADTQFYFWDHFGNLAPILKQNKHCQSCIGLGEQATHKDINFVA